MKFVVCKLNEQTNDLFLLASFDKLLDAQQYRAKQNQNGWKYYIYELTK